MKRKDCRITFRLTESEINQLKSKMADAGYTSAGAFIRDSVATGKVKPKISTSIVVIAKELAALAVMIKGDRPKSELLDKVRAIASANAGGVV
ncbi:plasmid mobilization protein [Pseudomonas juntendi]|uniref:plasmid mobilization protein n=1 Tax=Pseudomonas juntendi TaxID=2666183 RepID=UPI00345CCF16